MWSGWTGPAVVQEGTGNFLVLCGAARPDGTYGSYPLAVDPEGRPLRERQIDLPADSGFDHMFVVPTSDGGLAGAGTARVFRLDKDGAVLWVRDIEGPEGSTIEGIGSLDRTEDGGFVVAVAEDGPAGCSRVLLKLDGAGDIAWREPIAISPGVPCGHVFCGGVVSGWGPGGYWGPPVARTSRDGGFLVAESSGGSLALVRTDAGGQIVWRKPLALEAQAPCVFDLAAAEDGGALLVGSSVASQFSLGGDVLAVRTDAAGEVLWQRTIGDWPPEAATAAVPETGGGLVLAGFTCAHDPGWGGPNEWCTGLLTRLDPEGQVAWEATLTGVGYGAYAFSVAPVPSEGYLVSGTLGDPFEGWFSLGGPGGRGGLGRVPWYGGEPYLVRADSNGRVLWERDLSPPELVGLAARELEGGDLLAVGVRRRFGALWPRPYLVRTDPAGGLVWERDVPVDLGNWYTIGSEWPTEGQRIAETADGGWVLAATDPGFEGCWLDCPALLLRLDASGEVLWERKDGVTYPYRMEELAGGRFLLAGELLVLVDPRGQVLGERPLPNPGGILLALRATRDGGAILTGILIGSDLRAFRIGPGLEPLWEAPLLEAGESMGFLVAPVLEVGDGGLVVVIAVQRTAEAARVRVIKLSAGGALAWKRELEIEIGKAQCDGASMLLAPAPDGGFILAYTTTNICDDRIPATTWLARLEPDGLLIWGPRRADDAVWSSLKATRDGGYVVARSPSPPAGPGLHLAKLWPEGPSPRVPGDCNEDGRLDIADAVCVLGYLFLGEPGALPCGGGSREHPANLDLLDWQRDGQIDLSDGVAILQHIFLGGPPHPLDRGDGTCVPLFGCLARPCHS
ncbi:MAG: hypothetical protein HY721_35260 [Planctomycetes bacterium]|nr:hypothetical protein [Planctomycetota bacterium]